MTIPADRVHATGADGPEPASLLGSFRYHVATDTWVWSDEVYRIHGYPPGGAEPTMELTLEHKHPDDLARARELFAQVRRDGRPFSYYHRIIDATGHTLRVLTVGEGVLGGSPATAGRPVTGVHGYLVDLTAPTSDEQRCAVRASAEHRAAIEQAKGILMATYGVDADGAMAFLRRWSMDHNVRVAAVAEALVGSFEQEPPGNAAGPSNARELLERLRPA